MNEKKRFNVEQHTTLDNRIIDVFPVSHQYIHKLENELKYNPDNEITLQDDKGNKFVLIQTERIDMQVKLNETINKLQQENQQLKELVNGIREERDYLFNKLTFENQQLKEENKKLKKIIKVYENPNDITGMFENCDELKDSDIK